MEYPLGLMSAGKIYAPTVQEFLAQIKIRKSPCDFCWNIDQDQAWPGIRAFIQRLFGNPY